MAYPPRVQNLITGLRNKFDTDDSGEISLKDRHLHTVNKCRPPEQKTILMMAVELGKIEDVEFLLRIKDLEVNTRNKKDDTAADIAWNMKSYDILLILLQNDSMFPKKFSVDEVDTEGGVENKLKRLVEERKSLHKWIEEDNLEAIERYTKNHKSHKFYSTDNVSALSHAIEYKKEKVCSHLSSIMPNHRIPETLIDERKWIEDPEKSHILKLLHATIFSEKLNREEWRAVIDMYLELDTHKEIRWIMKVIQYEDFEVYFEIMSEFAIPGEGETDLGVTDEDGRIYIGGKGITKEEHYRKVHGTCAHEICHLAMLLIYENNWNPYHEGDKERKKIFTKIRDLYNGKKGMDTVITEAYKLYKKEDWESELIVRVPEIIGTYDKKKADKIFKTQISELHKYYKKYIIPDCIEFSNPDFHSKPLRQIKELSKYHGVVRGEDKRTSPFNENFLEKNKYEEYLIQLQNHTNCKVWYCTTSNPKLCEMHIFHEQKLKLPIHAEKRCLAFDLECLFNGEYYKIILEALKYKICITLILLVTKMKSAWEDKIKDLTEKLTEEKQVIIVTLMDICKELPQSKKLNYQWNDLSRNYQNALLKKLITYQGKSISLKKVLNNPDTKMMNPDLLWHIMSQDELSIGEGISSNWNERELYVERSFIRFVFKEENFQMEQMPSYYLFLTGVSELTGIMKKRSQTLSNYDDEINKGMYIFVPKNEKNNSELFKNFCSKIDKKSKQVFWIHHMNGKYLLRDWLGRSEDIENHFEEQSFDECQMLEETDGMSEVLVADDPGAGKSTSITSLIEKMKESFPEKLIFRVNFGEYLKEFPASPSLHSFLEFLQRVCKMNTPLEKMTFQAMIGFPRRVVLFFDGFDEMSTDKQSKTMESLQLLRKETQIQIWIFTRKQERLTLEEEMNAVSFSFRQFSPDDQCKYFNQFWKSQLISLNHEKENFDKTFQEILNNLKKYSGKCERLLKGMKELVNIRKENLEEFLKKINELDFSDYSILVINSVKDSILKGKFIVPLWLWMMANIILYSNLKIPDHRNRYAFYSDFMEEKVNTYLRVRCNMALERKSQENDFKKKRNKIFEGLWKFSDRVMRSEHYQEMPDMDEDDLQELVEIGLLRTEGEEYHFFHMTFAEFFFSQMFVEKIKSGKLASVNAILLSDVLTKESYREVRIFLDDFLEKDEIQSFFFPKILLQKFKLFEIYIEYCERINDRTGDWIWRSIFQGCEMHMKDSVDEKSILNILKSFPFDVSQCYFCGVVDLLNSTFTDRMLFIMFDSRVDVSRKFLFSCLKYIGPNDLKAMISIFEKIMNYKKSHLRSEVPSTDNYRGDVKVGLEIFEKEYKDGNGIFYFWYKSKINIFLVSAESINSIAFIEVLQFASTFMNREDISKCLQRTYDNENGILHLMTKRRNGNVLEDLREIQSMIGNCQLKKLLTMQNENRMTMLHILMRYSEDPKDVTSVLEFVEGVMEGELFKQFLTQKDNKGIFLISCANLHIMKDILVFMGRYFSNHDIRDMLSENKVHLGESIRETDCGLEEILYLEELLGNELFKEILIYKDEYGKTRLHIMMESMDGRKERADKLFVSDLNVYTSFLDSDSMRAFLFSKDNSGRTFLHDWAVSYRGSQYIDILRELHSILSPDAFQYLLNIRNKNGETFIHFYKCPISKLSFLDEFLGKEKLIKLVTSKNIYVENNYGWTRLHYINYLYNKFVLSPFGDDTYDVYILRKDLKSYSELLDESSFRDFILTKDEDGKTFYSYYYLRGKETVNKLEGILSSILSPDLFLELRKLLKCEKDL